MCMDLIAEMHGSRKDPLKYLTKSGLELVTTIQLFIYKPFVVLFLSCISIISFIYSFPF